MGGKEMKICENGVIRDMTDKEISATQAAQAELEEYERTRPRTPEEILTALMAAIEGGLSDG